MKNLFKENKPLFFVSVIGVAFILSGIYFGIKMSSNTDLRNHNKSLIIKNEMLQNQIDSLSSELFIISIDKGRYEFILDQFEQVKKDSLILDCIKHNTE